MRRPVPVPIVEALARRTDEYRRATLAVAYRDLANAVRELLPLASGPNPPAPRLTQRLAVLETALGNVPPADVLHGWAVLAIARRRSLG